MKITAHSFLLRMPAILRIALLIKRACKPTELSPISPSNSACGTKAATLSTTIKLMLPESASISTISSACSPLSGWERINSLISTPKFFA